MLRQNRALHRRVVEVAAKAVVAVRTSSALSLLLRLSVCLCVCLYGCASAWGRIYT